MITNHLGKLLKFENRIIGSLFYGFQKTFNTQLASK
jgi:hypothetical protein